jgi:hypothetical protein
MAAVQSMLDRAVSSHPGPGDGARVRHRFFEMHLKGAPASLLARPDAAFPEVRFLSSAAGSLADQK